MIRGISLFGSLTIAVLAFVAGALISQTRGWGQSVAIITIQNRTGTELRTFQIALDSCGRKITIESSALPNGKSAAIRYFICGEGGQIVRATLTSGKTVVSTEEYVESSYRSTAVVKADGIEISEHVL
ncbi:MAG: hypothetical protein ABI579_07895 [Candidatus Sumerlaeota bacterium]